MEELVGSNEKIINEMVPQAIANSTNYTKEFKKRMKLNGIFSEFENKASNELNFFIEESNRRYTKSKCGINLNTLIASTRKKCLNESMKILKDRFYNNSIIDEERNKMRYKGGQNYYKKLKYSMNIIRNPELKKKEINFDDLDIEELDLDENGINELLRQYNSQKNNNSVYNSPINKKKFDRKNFSKDRNKISEIINDEHKTLFKSIDNYKRYIKNLSNKNDETKKYKIGKEANFNLHKKINLDLPKLKLLNYEHYKIIPRDPYEDDEEKKVDIYKLLPYSKYGKYCYSINQKNASFNKSKDKNNDKTLPYITEPNIPDNSHYYRNYHNTIFVVADSANKELFVNKNFNKKREDVEHFLGVDEIPDLKSYENIIHKKSNSIKQERRAKYDKISQRQNYLKLTSKQRINVDIDRNLALIKNIENNLYGNKKADNNNNS
jgi:hypothetical protein